MRRTYIYSIAFLFVMISGYFGVKVLNEHIDQKSGEIVEQTLSDNTINQLKFISEVQALLDEGKIEEATEKLSDNTDTLLYILKENCNLPKCEDALRNYERR